MRTRRTYEKSFKVEAVKLANETSIRSAARSLGIHENTLRQWVIRTKERPDNPFIGSRNTYVSPADTERIALLRENQELKRANEILKEALGFFAQSQKK